MTSEEFVKSFYLHKQDLLNIYTNPIGVLPINSLIKSLDLDEERLKALEKILDMVLTDAYYSLLLGIDGEVNIGGTQHMYKLFDEENNELTGSGEIEGYAYQYFHEK